MHMSVYLHINPKFHKTYIHKHSYTRAYSHLDTHAHTYINRYIHMQVHMYIHIHIQTCTHTHTYTHVKEGLGEFTDNNSPTTIYRQQFTDNSSSTGSVHGIHNSPTKIKEK